jgi:hypothetical protein
LPRTSRTTSGHTPLLPRYTAGEGIEQVQCTQTRAAGVKQGTTQWTCTADSRQTEGAAGTRAGSRQQNQSVVPSQALNEGGVAGSQQELFCFPAQRMGNFRWKNGVQWVHVLGRRCVHVQARQVLQADGHVCLQDWATGRAIHHTATAHGDRGHGGGRNTAGRRTHPVTHTRPHTRTHTHTLTRTRTHTHVCARAPQASHLDPPPPSRRRRQPPPRRRASADAESPPRRKWWHGLWRWRPWWLVPAASSWTQKSPSACAGGHRTTRLPHTCNAERK